MNKRLLLLCFFCSHAFAEPESLAPVVDNSSYYNGGEGAVPGALESGRINNNTKGGNSANAMYEVLGQLEQLQKELRQLSGTVEEQAHDLAEIKKRQTTMYDDIDQRLQALETAKGAAVTAAPTVSETPAIPASTVVAEPPVSAPAIPPVETAAPASAAQPISALATPTPPGSTNAAPKYPQEIYSESKDSKPVTPAIKSSEKEQYQAAYDTLRDGHYSRAIEGLNAQLAAYPNGEYAANAQYWLGEAYKVTQNINAARDAFNKVVANYPASPKVADALLKLGYLEIEQDNMPKAREYLSRVSTGYPNTTAAHLAAKKLAALNGAPR